MPSVTEPDTMSATWASNGKSPNTVRPAAENDSSACQTPRGSAAKRIIEVQKDAAEFANAALTAEAAAHQSAPCAASAANAAITSLQSAPASAAGAKAASASPHEARESATTSSRANHTPTNLPTTKSRSRTATESSRSVRPVRRSSLHTSIARKAAATGSSAEAESAQSATTDALVPSAASSRSEKSAATAAMNSPAASAVGNWLRSRPTVRRKVTATGLTAPPPPAPRRRVRRAPRGRFRKPAPTTTRFRS